MSFCFATQKEHPLILAHGLEGLVKRHHATLCNLETEIFIFQYISSRFCDE